MTTHNACGTTLRPPLSEGMTWRFCPACELHIHAPCGAKECTCGKGKKPAPTAQKKNEPARTLASGSQSGVGSTSQLETTHDGASQTTTQEGPMATKTAKKKATKKATTKAAAKPEANGEVVKSDGTPDKRRDAAARRGRGELEAKVLAVVSDYEDGKVEVPEGKTLTPHRIATEIAERGEDKPSGGAVAAILKRWNDYGYALTHDKPFAFKATSARGKKQGLEELKEKHREKARKERAAAKTEAADA